MDTYEKCERLFAIKQEMLKLLRETRDIVKGTEEEATADSYWLANIRCALDSNHSYLDRSETMQDSIDALEADANEEDE
jgi:hypothetical protein